MQRFTLAVLLILAASPALAQSPDPAVIPPASGGGGAVAVSDSSAAAARGASAAIEQIGPDNSAGVRQGNSYTMAGFTLAPDASSNHVSIEQSGTSAIVLLQSGAADLTLLSVASQANGAAAAQQGRNAGGTQEIDLQDGSVTAPQEAEGAIPPYPGVLQAVTLAAEVSQTPSFTNNTSSTAQAGNGNYASIRQK